MPLMRCTKNGRPGWKFGVGGTCFVGPDARERAMKQAYAIGVSRARLRGNKGAKVEESAAKYVQKESA